MSFDTKCNTFLLQKWMFCLMYAGVSRVNSRQRVKSHLLGWDFCVLLCHIVWCGDIIGHVEVNVFVSWRWVQVGLLHIKRCRAKWKKSVNDSLPTHTPIWDGAASHLSKTSRQSASFLREGVPRGFRRSSIFSFRLCGHRLSEVNQIVSGAGNEREFQGFSLQRSLCLHLSDRSAETSCPLWSLSLPVMLRATERKEAAVENTRSTPTHTHTYTHSYSPGQSNTSIWITLLFEVNTSLFSFSHMSFEDFRLPLRLSYSLDKDNRTHTHTHQQGSGVGGRIKLVCQ